MNAKQVITEATTAASHAAGFVAFNEWSITLYRLGVGVLCYYLATNYADWKAAIEQIPMINDRQIEIIDQQDRNTDALERLVEDATARPDPFTGTQGRELLKRIESLERRIGETQ